MKSEYINNKAECVNIDCIYADRSIKHMKENEKIHIQFTAVPGAQHSAVVSKRKRQNHYGLIIKNSHWSYFVFFVRTALSDL